jgi:hypothetical protein
MKPQTLDRYLQIIEAHVRPPAIVIAGVLLSCAAALVPHHAHAIELLPAQALIGLVPYALYGVLAALLREPIVVRIGVAVLGLHLLAVLLQRGLSADHGSGPLLIIVPLLLAAAPLAVWPRALRESDPLRRGRSTS